MLVSIAISTFEAGGNGHNMVKFGLESIREQTYKNIEVVISDHSKDDKIKDMVATFPDLNIKYVRYHKNYGSNSCNTNNAMDHCSGDLIKILFMDDFLFPTCIATIVQAFEKWPQAMWLVNSYYHTHDRKTFFRLQVPKWSDGMLFGNNTIGCPSNLTIRKAIEERFDKELIYLMDCEYYFRLRQRYGNPIYCYMPLNVQLLHDEQLTSKGAGELKTEEIEYITKKYGL